MKLTIIFITIILFLFPGLVLATIIPNDPEFPNQWYLQSINAPAAWEKTTGSHQVIVAILDSGVEVAHPDIMDNIWTNPDEVAFNGLDDDHNGYVDDIYGWDFINNQSNPGPDFATSSTKEGFHHGTIIAGLIGAAGNNGTDGVGVNWQVKIMPLKVLNEIGEGAAPEVAQAIDYAIAKKADIINLSFISGPGEKLSEGFYQAIQRAHEAGIVMVVAAGNDAAGEFNLVGGDLDFNPRYPVCYDGPQGEPWWIIGVAALNQDDRKANFSDYGFRCVDISAPGVNIASSLVHHPNIAGFEKSFGGNWSGTSLATPLVAGAAALIKSLRPDFGPKEIYDALTQSADNIDSKNPFYLRQLGAGRLNLAKAVAWVEKKSERDLSVSGARLLVYSPARQPFLKLYDKKGKEIERALVKGLQNFLAAKYPQVIGSSSQIADLDNDGTDETIRAVLTKKKWQVKIFDESGLLKKSFLAYNKKEDVLTLTVGDIDGDGRAEIITAPAVQNPVVKIWSRQGKKKSEFKVKGDFRKGITVQLISF